MSRLRRGSRGKRPAAAPSRPGAPRARLPGRLAWAVPALLVAAALLWGPLHRRLAGTAAPPGEPREPAAIAGTSAGEALRTGLALGREGRDPESLPYFRRALRDEGVDSWQARYNYATALYNTTLRVVSRNGLPVHAVRSSWERIALVREAARQLARAEGLARAPRDVATVRAAHAQMAGLWGMPWDALAACRRAQDSDPADRGLAARGDALLAALRAPAAAAAGVR